MCNKEIVKVTIDIIRRGVVGGTYHPQLVWAILAQEPVGFDPFRFPTHPHLMGLDGRKLDTTEFGKLKVSLSCGVTLLPNILQKVRSDSAAFVSASDEEVNCSAEARTSEEERGTVEP